MVAGIVAGEVMGEVMGVGEVIGVVAGEVMVVVEDRAVGHRSGYCSGGGDGKNMITGGLIQKR